MIRRAAALVGTGDQGFVLAWLIKVDSTGNQTMTMVFEKAADGTVSEQADSNIKFADGSPANIPVIE